MSKAFYHQLRAALDEIDAAGLYKRERLIATPQSSGIEVSENGSTREVINFCANNYLGLAASPEIIAAAQKAMDDFGYGMASVRFICGTQTLHRDLEQKIASFFGYQAAILYIACFDANGGLYEPLLGPEDAIISDSLNHASIIDGVRLCKAGRFRYANNDMADLEEQLKAADGAGARFKMIVTDGVFSMDGIIANLPGICDLADKYGALVMVDDSHASGFIGDHGRGTPEHCGVEGRIDILTSTLGKALGGGAGGFTAAKREVIDMLRQRSRPYLFSNSLPPALAAGAIKALDLIKDGDALRKKLMDNAAYFRKGMEKAGFDLVPGNHPIIPVMLGEARVAQDMAAKLLERGIYVIGFFFPVVPRGEARIRAQMSAAHTTEQLDQAITAFSEVGKELGVIS
ncbi:MAG: glycine C-acetyltransferase [Proteobacteria bacterium]|nr:glycine C-acetyltransferase [Pseudomonadota bacterium]